MPLVSTDQVARVAASIVEGGEPTLIVAPRCTQTSSIARRVADGLEPLGDDELVWLAAARELAGLPVATALAPLRLRAPHSSVSSEALSGPAPRIGELQLARHGVLFLDDLPEFKPHAITLLADRAQRMAEEGRPLILASAPPCPCGALGSSRRCLCTPASVASYVQRRDDMASALGITRTITLVEGQ